jgi:hypothetical protein
MAYDRFDPRIDRNPRRDRDRFGRDRWDEPTAWRGGRERDDERGFFERAGDWISSTFGDDDDDRRPRADYDRGFDRDDRYAYRGRDRAYRPMTGDYGRAEPRRERSRETASGIHDPHYQSWRERQMAELDRDYDEYRRENQSRFESEFGSWREQRMQKRSLLGQVRENMEVVGNDDQPVGTVDKVAGDRLILAKSDPESGGSHHSLSCRSIDRIEGNRVMLGCSAEQAMKEWRDDDRERALFERDDQGEVGPHMLDRSFAGTYR